MNAISDQDPIPLKSLLRAIYDFYGIEGHSLHFRAKGWGGFSYFVAGASGNLYYLKRQPLSGPEWASAPSEPRFYLPLLHQLHAQNIINVPKLVLTRDGGYSAVVDGYELVLYDFIDGEVVGFGRMPEPVLAEVAEMVGKLHGAIPHLRIEHEFRETYALSIEKDLLRSLERLAGPDPAATPGIERLRVHADRIRVPVLAHLDRFRALQAYARELDKPQVICHTDLHGGNLMFDQKGELILLDWENAMLAPPEHDLFFIVEKPEFWDVFLPRYEREAGPVDLDPDLFGFYFYRRALEDIAGFISRILAEEGDQERDKDDIAGIHDNLNWMDSIEASIADIRTRLANQ